MSFHPKILSATQMKILQRACAWVTSRGFYLAGGTAVALQLGHPESADFDWFGEDPIAEPERLVAEFEEGLGSEFTRDHVAPGTIVGSIAGVKASFFHLPFRLLEKPSEWRGCLFASLRDLAAMKLLAIAQRGRKRDFIDVHALLEIYELAEMIDLFTVKYPSGSIDHLLVALTYFDDAEDDPMPRMFTRVTWAKVKREIAAEVRRYAKE